MQEKLLYVTGKCTCCNQKISGLIPADVSHFLCPTCKGLVPKVFCNTSEHCPDVHAKRLDQTDDD